MAKWMMFGNFYHIVSTRARSTAGGQSSDGPGTHCLGPLVRPPARHTTNLVLDLDSRRGGGGGRGGPWGILIITSAAAGWCNGSITPFEAGSSVTRPGLTKHTVGYKTTVSAMPSSPDGCADEARTIHLPTMLPLSPCFGVPNQQPKSRNAAGLLVGSQLSHTNSFD